MKKIPILVLAFNRADHVVEAMKVIQKYKPDRLYLECDGPRESKPGEREDVEATRKIMMDSVDWQCEVKTLFRERNLGCAQAVYEAISWFFENEEYGVVVEEDMVIGLDFFRLCEELLPRYERKDQLMSIQCINWNNRIITNYSYVYSWQGGCNGWATWRRSWAKMDMSMSALPSLSYLKIIRKYGLLPGLELMRNYWAGYKHLESFSSWAYRWSLSMQANDGISIVPCINLGKDIGCSDGTHYGEYDDDPFKDLIIGNLEWPLIYNDTFKIDKKLSRLSRQRFYRNLVSRIKKKLRIIFRIKKNNYGIQNSSF